MDERENKRNQTAVNDAESRVQQVEMPEATVSRRSEQDKI